jgi:hypothetical protein
MTATSDAFKDIVPPLLHPPLPSPTFTMFAPADILSALRGCAARYRRTTQEEELAWLYHIPIPKQTVLPISYNIAPSQKVLTIRFNPQTQEHSLDAMQWGFTLILTDLQHRKNVSAVILGLRERRKS